MIFCCDIKPIYKTSTEEIIYLYICSSISRFNSFLWLAGQQLVVASRSAASHYVKLNADVFCAMKGCPLSSELHGTRTSNESCFQLCSSHLM